MATQTNSGSDPVPVDLVYTPEGNDGFDGNAVLRASIVIPPNDVVSFKSPLPSRIVIAPLDEVAAIEPLMPVTLMTWAGGGPSFIEAVALSSSRYQPARRI